MSNVGRGQEHHERVAGLQGLPFLNGEADHKTVEENGEKLCGQNKKEAFLLEFVRECGIVLHVNPWCRNERPGVWLVGWFPSSSATRL